MTQLVRLQELIAHATELETDLANEQLQSKVMARSLVSSAREALVEARHQLQKRESGTWRLGDK